MAPLVEQGVDVRGLVLVCAMAFVSGAADVCGVVRLHDGFVAFMSGNTTRLALWAGRGEWSRLPELVYLPPLFVAGAILGGVIAFKAGRHHATAVTLAVACILLIPTLLPASSVIALTVGMGALNAAVDRAGKVTIGVTYITGALAKFGQGIGHLLCGQRDDWVWAWQAVPMLGLAAGAVGASVVLARWGEALWWPMPAMAFGVAALSPFLRPRG